MLGTDCAVNAHPFLTVPAFPHMDMSLSRSFCGALVPSSAGAVITDLHTHVYFEPLDLLGTVVRWG